MTTTNSHGHDMEPALGTTNPDAIRAGHEPDAFAVKPIMSVPLAVVVTFVIAFSVAAGAFAYFNGAPPQDPYAHPDAVERSREGTNARWARTERAGLEKNPRREVDQPRLEPLQLLEKDGMYFSRPPLPKGNSPEIHVDDIKPDRVADLHTRGLNESKQYAHIPIGEAMDLVIDKKLLPVNKNGSKPTPSAERPTAASGGAGVEPKLPKVEKEAKKK